MRFAFNTMLVEVLLPLLILATVPNATYASLIQPRIIGGADVDIAKYPYLVSIRYQLRNVDGAYWHKCAGVIYTERVVVTAAQCIHDIETERVMIVAGGNRRTGADGMLHPASKWVAHADYSPVTADYDIGIIIMDLPFDLTHWTLHAVGIRMQRPAPGRVAAVAGWGYREEFGPSSYSLEETKVPIVSEPDCVRVYGASEVSQRMICAGYMDVGGRDACQGDTGGPLMFDGELVGLVSWGQGCARPGYPSVYTYVASLKQWLDETIAANVK